MVRASRTRARPGQLTAWQYEPRVQRPFLPAPWASATVAQMIADLDIWRAANLLVKRHGDDAAIVAARRADELLAEGDHDGCAIWKRILAAVNELTRTKPIEGERVN